MRGEETKIIEMKKSFLLTLESKSCSSALPAVCS
jgi:hypothetical protein